MRPYFSLNVVWSGAITLHIVILFCSQSMFAIFPSGNPCTLDSVIVTPASCNGTCDGSINLYLNFTFPVQYSWQEFPGINTPDLNRLCAGTYHFTITDSVGCNIADSIVISEPPPVAFSILSQGTTCPGGCTGSLTVIPADTLPYTFYWPGYMSTSAFLNTLCQGTYNVIVTDAQGCSRIQTGDVDYIPPFQLSFISAPASCLSSCNGMAAVIANGLPPFNYLWGTGPMQNTQTAFNLCYGSYIVNVTDSIGCVVTDSVFIDHLAPVDVLVNGTSPSCFGGCDGSAGVSVSPVGAYSYEWNTSPPQFSATATGLCAGNYIVAVMDLQSGCEYFESVEIINPSPNLFSFAVTPTYCNNICTGTVSVSINSSPPFSYLWSNGCTSQSDSMLCPGIYTVTVTDSIGCSSEGSVSVGSESLVLYSSNTTCNNLCDGSAGLIFPFQSQWNIDWLTVPVQHSEIISGLCEGYYEVAIVDSSGCELNGSVLVQSSEPILSFAQVTEISCIGICDGSAKMFVSGNNPFQFVWNTVPVQNTDSVYGLCAGNYEVTITDSLGCSKTDSVYVGAPEPELVNFFTVPNSCALICDAVIEAIPATASLLTYVWNTVPPQSGSVATGLCPGLIFVEITDSTGCSHIDSIMIIDTPPININFNVVGISCTGLCDGFIACQASGGNPGFSYQWSNGFQTPQVINLCPGSYAVTVTDVSGCTNTSSLTILDPALLTVSFDVIPASCATCNDGSIQAIVNGGTDPYFYLWNPGGVGNALLDSLLPGMYNLCVVDQNNCSYCDDIFVTDLTGLAEGNVNSGNVRVFPNPFSEKADIIISGHKRNNYDHFTYTVADTRGRIMEGVKITYLSNGPDYLRFEILANNMASGFYFLRIFDSEGNYFNSKFVISSGKN